MIFTHYYLPSLSHASYLLGDEGTGLAVIVDPQRDIEQYLSDLHTQSLILRYVFLTHFHTEFVAGHLELQRRTGAEICLGTHANADYTFKAIPDGFEIELGTMRLKILETPGHTPESISIVVFNHSQSREKPYAVLTGDTLGHDNVGRPDLMAAVGGDPKQMAAQLYDSLHNKLLALPDESLVCPTHGADFQRGNTRSTDTSTTIGIQRESNYALQPMSQEAFVTLVTTSQPEAPEYFGYAAFLNRREHPTLSQKISETLNPLDLDEVIHLKSTGAQVLDTRTPKDFALGHVCGSLNISLDGKFETWAGIILSREIPIILIADPGREKEAIIRLGRIGYDHVAGYLRRSMHALASTPELTCNTDRISAVHLNKLLMTSARPHILDVRSRQEWQQRRIDESRNIPLPVLTQHLQEIPQDHPVVIHSAGGYRSSIGLSILHHHGFTNIKELIGGFNAWEEEIVNPSLTGNDLLSANRGALKIDGV